MISEVVPPTGGSHDWLRASALKMPQIPHIGSNPLAQSLKIENFRRASGLGLTVFLMLIRSAERPKPSCVSERPVPVPLGHVRRVGRNVAQAQQLRF
jgi:hypothetical protein